MEKSYNTGESKVVHNEIETEKEMSKDEMIDRMKELLTEIKKGKDTPNSLGKLEQISNELLEVLKNARKVS